MCHDPTGEWDGRPSGGAPSPSPFRRGRPPYARKGVMRWGEGRERPWPWQTLSEEGTSRRVV